MLSNVLKLLIHSTIKYTKHPDAPVFYMEAVGQDRYQIIVQKIPKQETVVA